MGLPSRQCTAPRQRGAVKVAGSITSNGGGSEAARADDALSAVSLSLSADVVQHHTAAYDGQETEEVGNWMLYAVNKCARRRAAEGEPAVLASITTASSPGIMHPACVLLEQPSSRVCANAAWSCR